jgi:inward rectifier potassium channel
VTVTATTDDDALPPAPAPTTEPTDLGFGRVVAQQVRGRFLSHDGVPTSKKYGLGAQRAARFYLSALNTGWPSFFVWLIGILLLMNGCFAIAYASLGDGALQGVAALGLDDPFLRAFSFSIGVFTTTGTAAMHAVGTTANWLVIFESLIGPLTLVAASGLLIARLTRPRMNLRFSESAIVAPYEGGRGLMFRMVNISPSELSDVQVRVNLALFEDIDGKRERNFHQLALERNSVEFFTLHWTVVHPITADSPLAGYTPEKLAAAEAEILVLANAHEETFSTRVTARTSYLWDEVRWDVKYASIFANGPEGVLAIDVDRLDRTERLPEGATSRPATIEQVGAPAA